MGLLTIRLFQKNKGYDLSPKRTAALFKLLAELLKNGFSINESLLFMRKAKAFPEPLLLVLLAALERGEWLTAALFNMGVSPEIITQLEFAQQHGDLAATLQGIEQHLGILQKQRENLGRIFMYPAILLIFLFGALIGMRQFLLPQLEMSGFSATQNPGLQVVRASPYLLGGLAAVGSLVIIGLSIYFKKKSHVSRARLLAQVPLLRSYYVQYVSAFFALEWGKLFSQGMEIKQIIQVMADLRTTSLMKELAASIESQLIEGVPFYDQLQAFPFLTSELSLIIRQGEVKGNLGKELMIYSDLCRNTFFVRIEKLIQWIQPVVFLIIAVAIVSIYAAMLLPIYGGIDQL